MFGSEMTFTWGPHRGYRSAATAEVHTQNTASKVAIERTIHMGVGCLTLALSGRPPRPKARGRRKMNDALAARQGESSHRPLERVVRQWSVQTQAAKILERTYIRLVLVGVGQGSNNNM